MIGYVSYIPSVSPIGESDTSNFESKVRDVGTSVDIKSVSEKCLRFTTDSLVIITLQRGLSSWDQGKASGPGAIRWKEC